jgi:hypothetical protein
MRLKPIWQELANSAGERGLGNWDVEFGNKKGSANMTSRREDE